MADINDVIRADGAHILCWQARLGQLRHGADLARGPDLSATWDTVATLIDLHARAEEDVCDQVIYGTERRDSYLAGKARDERQDMHEIIGETGLQLLGSPRWWELATTALAVWARHFDDEEHGPPADYRRSAERGLRKHLAHQWRAFTEAAIRDQSYPTAPPDLPTCQLRLARPATPRLADLAFGPLACTCQSCTDRLDWLSAHSDGIIRRGAAFVLPWGQAPQASQALEGRRIVLQGQVSYRDYAGHLAVLDDRQPAYRMLAHQPYRDGCVVLRVDPDQVTAAERAHGLIRRPRLSDRPDYEVAVGHQPTQGLLVDHEDGTDSPVPHGSRGVTD